MDFTTINWLHLSDFHLGKDNYGQIKLIKSIRDFIDSLLREGKEIHYIFLTGDIANKGLSNEYELFLDEFMYPVYDKTQDFCKLFMVPGNHDIDRYQARAVKRYNIVNDIPEFFDPTDKGLFERKVLFDRFKNYKDSLMHELTSSGSDWLFSKEGIFLHKDNFGDNSIGIMGINTAWLSGEGNDEKNLSPGKSLIENGLDEINDCSYKIVLGHHPTNWFDEDIDPISALFSKNNIIYLHGHLHKSSVSQIFGAGAQYYSFQSGASFQAREDEFYKNRILLYELNFSENFIKLNPYQWSKKHQEWCIDGEAFPDFYREKGKDYWSIPLDFKFNQEKNKIKRTLKLKKTKEKTIPSKWGIIDNEFISSKSVDIDDVALLSFFDGRKPNWKDGFSIRIPKRKIVKELIEKVANFQESNEPNVVLLYGAGGEGKSIVLMQTVNQIVQKLEGIKIFHIEDSDEYRPWPMRFILALPKIAHSWIIVCDDADYIAKNIFDTVKSLSRTGRRDIHFLISSRDTDWISSKAPEWPWRSYCNFDQILLRGLNYEDCELIIKAWNSIKDGLGLLSQYDSKEASNRLFLAAKTEEAKDDHEGAFLGAMLSTRKGDRLNEHIKILLGRLNERVINRKKSNLKLTLMDAFSYIAAMHSEGLYFLTKDLLSEVIFCDMGEIKRQVIGPLGEEALASSGGTFIFTRHRSISESSVKILSEIYHIDFDEVFIELVQAAQYMREKGAYVPNFSKWKFFSSHFFDKGQISLAIRLDQALLEISPSDTYLIVHLSSLFRKSGQPELSLNLFREHATAVRGNVRSFFYEWATSEGSSDNHAMSIVCTFYSLSDQVEMRYPEIKHIRICFEGLFIAFSSLWIKFNISSYENSRGAICKIAEKLKMPYKNRKKFSDRYQEFSAESLDFSDYKSAFETLLKGLSCAWDQRETDYSTYIPDPSMLTFDCLKKILDL